VWSWRHGRSVRAGRAELGHGEISGALPCARQPAEFPVVRAATPTPRPRTAAAAPEANRVVPPVASARRAGRGRAGCEHQSQLGPRAAHHQLQAAQRLRTHKAVCVVEDQPDPHRQRVEGLNEIGEELELDAAPRHYEAVQPAVLRHAGTGAERGQHSTPQAARVVVVGLEVHPGRRRIGALSHPVCEQQRFAVARRGADQRQCPIVTSVQSLQQCRPSYQTRRDRRWCDLRSPEMHGSPRTCLFHDAWLRPVVSDR
jgi:hypothetical protein